MIRTFACLLLFGGCASETEAEPCPALVQLRADDEVVAGTTAEALVAASSQARGPVDLAWLFGGLSTATVRLVGRPGTARLAQRPDCLAECETEYQLLMACGPDELEVGLAGSISTADGLLSREHFDGHAFGRQTDRGLEWRGYAAVQGSTLNGTLDPLAHTDYADARDPRVLLWLYGVGEELSGIDVGLQITRTVAGEDAEVHSSLGGTP